MKITIFKLIYLNILDLGNMLFRMPVKVLLFVVILVRLLGVLGLTEKPLSIQRFLMKSFFHLSEKSNWKNGFMP